MRYIAALILSLFCALPAVADAPLAADGMPVWGFVSYAGDGKYVLSDETGTQIILTVEPAQQTQRKPLTPKVTNALHSLGNWARQSRACQPVVIRQDPSPGYVVHPLYGGGAIINKL